MDLLSRRRHLLVTGGSRGIGAAIVRRAVADDYAVCFGYRAREDEAAALCGECGDAVSAVRADLADEAGVERCWQEALKRLDGRIDVLVNNAGIVAPQMPLAEMDDARIRRGFAVNVFATLGLCAAAVRHMSRSRGGAGGVIVNVGSIAAKLGAAGEYVDYAAAKGAVDSLTRGLAREVAGEGIRVNAVRPGSVHTEIHADGGEPDRVRRVSRSIPLGRGGEPGEIAAAVLWLASTEASYVTGAILDVSGGL